MRSPGEALSIAEPTPEQAAAVLAVRAAVADWAAGRIDVWGVRRRCSGPDRWTAARCTPPADPHHGPLMACLGALIEGDRHSQGGRHWPTKHGAISDRDIWDAGGEVRVDGAGGVLIRFPGERGVP